MLTETAYAKVNLALHVRRRRDDGYHEIETVFAFCEHGDTVGAAIAPTTTLTVDGPFAEGLSTTDNLVVRAAAAMRQQARLHLTKRLPVASGIGGGSADAGAALRLLARLYNVPLPDLAAQRALGADVPACVASTTARGEGDGGMLSPAGSVAGMPILLVNPGVPLSTAAVFRAWDGQDRGALDEWRDGRNDLETSARALVPQIGDLLDWLGQRRDVIMARMSGSGATCFALFDDQTARRRVAVELASAFPTYWQLESSLR